MNASHYRGWVTFTVSGERFLGLVDDGGVHIYGDKFSNFGKWLDAENFKKRFRLEGDSLRLDSRGD